MNTTTVKIAIAGATGLTGSLCLQLLLQSREIGEIVAIGRKPTGIEHPKLTESLLTDGLLREPVYADAFICCLGTTLAKAGSKKAFKEIDYDLPLHLATVLHSNGCKTAAFVSSVGANPKSLFFYTRTKGELEESLKEIGFSSLSILRPSFIAGERQERRSGEGFMLGMMKLLGPLMKGRLAKYRSASADSIAAKLLAAVLRRKAGTSIYYFPS